MTGNTDITFIFFIRKTMFHTVFYKWLEQKYRKIHLQEFRWDINIIAEFSGKAYVLDSHIALNLLEFFLKSCNRKFFQIIPYKFRHTSSNGFDFRYIMNFSK